MSYELLDELDREFRMHRLKKEAGFWNALKSSFNGGAIARRLGDAAVGALAVGATGATIHGTSLLANKLLDGRSRARGFKAMMELNPGLGRLDAKKVQATYNSLHNMNPGVARDPLISGGFVAKTMQYGDHETLGLGGGYIDPNTVRTIAARDDGRPGTITQQFLAGTQSAPVDWQGQADLRQRQALTLKEHEHRLTMERERGKAQIGVKVKLWEQQHGHKVNFPEVEQPTQGHGKDMVRKAPPDFQP